MFQINRFAARGAVLALTTALLAACTPTYDFEGDPEPMGRFLLGHNVALVVDDIDVPSMSRELDEAVWVDTVRREMNTRFSRYDGDQYYHISTAIVGYILAKPGVPQSILAADVFVFRDADGGKPLTEEPKRFTVFETGGGATAEEQAQSLARNLAKQVHDWMLENKDWFGDAALMDPAMTSPGRPVQPLDASDKNADT